MESPTHQNLCVRYASDYNSTFSSHCNITIIDEKYPALNKFYNALDSWIKELGAQGGSIEVKQAKEIIIEEENQLWESGEINFDNAQGLSNGVFFYNCKYKTR